MKYRMVVYLIKVRLICFVLALSMVCLVFPLSSFAVEVNPFSVKWGVDLFSFPGVEDGFSTLVMPVTGDVVGDGWHEVFLSLGFDHDFGDEGIVFCLDGHDGSVIWSYYSDYFGSHTCLELYDVDKDGRLELLATGYHHVVMFNAEDGSVLWEFTRLGNRQDKPAVILEEDGVVYVFTVSHRGDNGIGLQKRLGATGVVVKEVSGPLHPCHGGLSCEDLDGDGSFELICTDRSSGRGVQCYDTDLNLLWYNIVDCSSHLANIVDVNGDGVFDVVVMDQGDGSAGVCVVDGSTGDPMSGKWSLNLGLWAHYTPAVYDVDQDGRLELITSMDASGARTSVWDLESWSLDATLWRHDAPYQYGLCKPPQIANVFGGGDMEMVFCTHAGFDVFDKNFDLVAYHYDGYAGRADRMVIQDIDDDGLNEIVAVMHESGTGSMTYVFVQCLDTVGSAAVPRARSENFLYSLRRNGVSVFIPVIGGDEIQDDLISPLISDVDIIFSNPLDTELGFGWVNITCSVTDNLGVGEVLLKIRNPDDTMSSISMFNIAGSSFYYCNTSFLFSGVYSYFILADDVSGNPSSSISYDFSMPPNWDINSDGCCNVLDYVLISNHYGENGGAGWIREDVDNNGQIQILDLVFVSNHYNESWWV